MLSGCPKTNNTLFKCETKLNRFHGCMQHIFIDNEQLDIDITLQRQWARYEELLIGTCGITDRYEMTQSTSIVCWRHLILIFSDHLGA